MESHGIRQYDMANDDPQEEAFWHFENQDTTRAYADRVGKPYMFCYNRLRELEDLGLIFRSKIGPRRTIWNLTEEGQEIKEDLLADLADEVAGEGAGGPDGPEFKP